uniref:UDP-N-acetylglucosamine:LPS N-acetylglucosamine transferase n=1 Tax=uncultured verrucomicrobium HF0500_08N17 TaxID=723597 RepID=E7C4Y6_9BACT|nr:UDP-N-acetylglucosamine:LPS N-acetylglucosamine transferase [uncultured verrucomicrobium HF0500_08N17]
MNKKNKKLRVCCICSVGGHFKQILKIAGAWDNYDYFFVLFYKPVIDSFMKKEKVYLVCSPERNPFLFIYNIFQSLLLFIKTKPDVVISTGAGMAIAMCYIAKLFGKKVIYIEDWCVVQSPTLTARIVYPIADLFIIQREHLIEFFPNAVFGGEIF